MNERGHGWASSLAFVCALLFFGCADRDRSTDAVCLRAAEILETCAPQTLIVGQPMSFDARVFRERCETDPALDFSVGCVVGSASDCAQATACVIGNQARMPAPVEQRPDPDRDAPTDPGVFDAGFD